MIQMLVFILALIYFVYSSFMLKVKSPIVNIFDLFSSAYCTAYLFYFIVVFLPNNKKEMKVKKLLNSQLTSLYKEIYDLGYILTQNENWQNENSDTLKQNVKQCDIKYWNQKSRIGKRDELDCILFLPKNYDILILTLKNIDTIIKLLVENKDYIEFDLFILLLWYNTNHITKRYRYCCKFYEYTDQGLSEDNYIANIITSEIPYKCFHENPFCDYFYFEKLSKLANSLNKLLS